MVAEADRMLRALAIADRGVGLTRPNPPVGAVVTNARGRVVGEGFHRRAGGAHAEVKALDAAGDRARGGTIFITLEPCSTHGRTPPCTDRILASGVRRVVVSATDPNPRHAGRGLALLKRAGLNVSRDVCRAEGQRLLAPFAKWITTGRPLITLKLAMSLDGRIADRNGRSKWITSAAARRHVQELRRLADAVMVGAGTAVADNPSLLYRRRPSSGALRIVVDSAGRTPLANKVFSDGHAGRTIVATTARCPDATVAAFEARGAVVWRLPARQGRVSTKALVRTLGKVGLLHVLCEGGSGLAGELVRETLVDRYVLFMAPRVLGPEALPCVGGRSWRLPSAPELRIEQVAMCGPDIRVDVVPRERT